VLKKINEINNCFFLDKLVNRTTPFAKRLTKGKDVNFEVVNVFCKTLYDFIRKEKACRKKKIILFVQGKAKWKRWQINEEKIRSLSFRNSPVSQIKIWGSPFQMERHHV